MAFTVSTYSRRAAMAALLALAVLGGVIRYSAPNPSTLRDIGTLLLVLWVQLVVGLITLPYSLQHADGSVMLILADWAQRIVTLRPVDATALAALGKP